MANFVANSQLFIPLSDREDASNGEFRTRLANRNNVGVVQFDGVRIKRIKHSSENHGTVPWKKRACYSQGVVGLHEEINDFFDVMSPLPEEKEVRLIVVKHIEKTVLSMWPHAKVEVFGSFNTGLYLPTSDIDVVVSGKWDNLPLQTMKAALVRNGIEQSDVEILSNAAVPIVRLLHTPTKVKVDISFNVSNGVRSAELIKDSMREYPELAKLVLVLKQFLLHRHLNEVYYGGMSSYALTLLVLSFLQAPHKPKSLPTTNLGTLLMEFFELYGLNFNYEKVAISVLNGGYYYPKRNPWGSQLSIDDPHCSDNDIARGTYSILVIKNSFENAYNCLHKVLTESSGERPNSLLQLILDVDPAVISHRNWTVLKFPSLVKRFSSLYEDDAEKEHKENNANIYPIQGQRNQLNSSHNERNCNMEKSNGPSPSVRSYQKTMFFYHSANQPRNGSRNSNQSIPPKNKVSKQKKIKRSLNNVAR